MHFSEVMVGFCMCAHTHTLVKALPLSQVTSGIAVSQATGAETTESPSVSMQVSFMAASI